MLFSRKLQYFFLPWAVCSGTISDLSVIAYISPLMGIQAEWLWDQQGMDQSAHISNLDQICDHIWTKLMWI